MSASIRQQEQKLAAMRRMQDERALPWINSLAARCFDECVTDMAFTRQLRSSEEECVSACTAKFVAVSSMIGERFSDLARS